MNPGRNVRHALAGAWTAALLYALLDPEPGVSSPFAFADKLVHFALFAGFGALWTWAERGFRVWVVVFGGLLAGVTEVIQQYWMAGRSGDLLDAVFDVFGLACGVLVSHLRHARAPAAKTNAP